MKRGGRWWHACERLLRRVMPRRVPARAGLDFVTVCFLAEIPLLKMQARSFARFASPDEVGSIVIIVNDVRFAACWLAIRREVLPEYGRLRRKVRIRFHFQLTDGLAEWNGWFVQQVLKVAIARHICAKQYVCLDAKNFFVRPVTRDAFIDPETGRYRSHLIIRNSIPGYLAKCYAYFGLPAPSLPVPPTTPFVLAVRCVIDLIDTIERREAKPFDAFFLATSEISEFWLYAAFVEVEHGFTTLYSYGPALTCTLWDEEYPSIEAFRDALFSAAEHGAVCVGLHRRRVPRLTEAERAAVAELWQSLGLVRDRAEAETLLTRGPTDAEGIPLELSPVGKQ